jgi:xanthine dehydrogenase YagT iron-sulfur-binding subunit
VSSTKDPRASAVLDPPAEAKGAAGKKESPFSRRGFLQGSGVGAGILTAGVLATPEEAEAQSMAGTSTAPVEITLNINGRNMKATVEPRVTLLDCFRQYLDLTAAKRVCDRGTCGACTCIVDGKVMYSCTILAIDAQGRKIETLEGVAAKKHPIIQAFVNNDAQQCGYCTPGMVMASKGFLDRNPSPSFEQVKKGLGGNLCRCGTYMGIRKAVLEASNELKGGATKNA